MDYGKGYIYDHDTQNTFSGQEYFPDEMIKNDKCAGNGFPNPIEVIGNIFENPELLK